MIIAPRILLTLSLFVCLGSAARTESEALSVRDIKSFGTTYFNTNVSILAAVLDAYQCNAPGNEGFVCITVRDMQAGDTILTKEKAISIEFLRRWSQENKAIKFTGHVESRRAVDGNSYPSLIVRQASVVPEAELTSPLNPRWSFLTTLRQMDEVDIFADSRSLTVSGSTVSLWVRLDHERPKLATSGRPYLSEVRHYEIDCSARRSSLLGLSQYEDRRAGGRRVYSSLLRLDAAVAQKTVEAVLLEHISRLCKR